MALDIQDLGITSTAFEDDGRIPARHARDGDDISPALTWSGVPDGTRQLALVCHDPDAPLPDGFTHWLVYGIPADVDGIEEGGGDAFTQGVNDFGDTGYGGPMPPQGHGTHHYYFWVYALDADLDLAPGLDRRSLLDRIGDHVIEQNRTVGTYER